MVIVPHRTWQCIGTAMNGACKWFDRELTVLPVLTVSQSKMLTVSHRLCSRSSWRVNLKHTNQLRSAFRGIWAGRLTVDPQEDLKYHVLCCGVCFGVYVVVHPNLAHMCQVHVDPLEGCEWLSHTASHTYIHIMLVHIHVLSWRSSMMYISLYPSVYDV